MITQNNIRTISDLRFKTKEVLDKAGKEPVFVFHHSRPSGVLISFEKYQELQDTVEEYYASVRAEEYEGADKKNVVWTSHKDVKKRLQKNKS